MGTFGGISHVCLIVWRQLLSKPFVIVVTGPDWIFAGNLPTPSTGKCRSTKNYNFITVSRFGLYLKRFLDLSAQEYAIASDAARELTDAMSINPSLRFGLAELASEPQCARFEHMRCKATAL